jgi:hypothetical protein
MTTVPAEPRTEEQVRREIAATREELGRTVAALAVKTDVKARAKERVDAIKQRALGKKDELAEKRADLVANDTTHGGPGALAQRAVDTARSNPVVTGAAIALLVGFALGRRRRRGG